MTLTLSAKPKEELLKQQLFYNKSQEVRPLCCRGNKDFVFLYGARFMEQMDFSPRGVRGPLVFIKLFNTLITEN